MLDQESIDIFATHWGRWCLDTKDCYPERASCASLEKNYRSPQRWTDDRPIFTTPYDVICAETFERLAHTHLTWLEMRVITTHWVALPWWWLEEWQIPKTEWLRRRIRHSRARGVADYMSMLEQAHEVMGKALVTFDHLLHTGNRAAA